MSYPKKIFMSIPEAGMHGNTLELNIIEALTLWCKAYDLNDENSEIKIQSTKKCIRRAMEFLHREMKCEGVGSIVGKAFGYRILAPHEFKHFLNKEFIVKDLDPEILLKIDSLPGFFDTFVL